MLLRNEDQFLIVDGLEIEMANLKCLFSVVEAAEKIMAEWSDEEDNIDIVLLPPENIDAVTDDEEVDENGERVDNRMPNDISGTIEIQTNIPEIEEKVQIDNNECTNSDTNAERNEKEERVLEILEEIEECKTKTMKWKEHVSTKNAFLSAINDESGRIKEAKSRTVDKFAGKEPHEIFEQYVNAELKAMIVEETNRYAAQKNIRHYLKQQIWKHLMLCWC